MSSAPIGPKEPTVSQPIIHEDVSVQPESPVSKVAQPAMAPKSEGISKPISHRKTEKKSGPGLIAKFLATVRGFTIEDATLLSKIKKRFSQVGNLIKKGHEGIKNGSDSIEKQAKNTQSQTAGAERARMHQQILNHLSLIDKEISQFRDGEQNIWVDLSDRHPKACKDFPDRLDALTEEREDLEQLTEIHYQLILLETSIETYKFADNPSHEEFVKIRDSLTRAVSSIKGRCKESPKVEKNSKLNTLVNQEGNLTPKEAHLVLKAAHPEIAPYFDRMNSQISEIRKEKATRLNERAEKVLDLEKQIRKVMLKTRRASPKNKEEGRAQLVKLFGEIEKLQDFDPNELKWMKKVGEATPVFAKAGIKIDKAGEALPTLKADAAMFTLMEEVKRLAKKAPTELSAVTELKTKARQMAELVMNENEKSIPKRHHLINNENISILDHEFAFRVDSAFSSLSNEIKEINESLRGVLAAEMSLIKGEIKMNAETQRIQEGKIEGNEKKLQAPVSPPVLNEIRKKRIEAIKEETAKQLEEYDKQFNTTQFNTPKNITNEEKNRLLKETAEAFDVSDVSDDKDFFK